MTSDIQDLITMTFRLCYGLHLSPAEVDSLSTYETREYLGRLIKAQSEEQEQDSNMFRGIAQVFGLRKKI